jgi:hypothetical protein
VVVVLILGVEVLVQNHLDPHSPVA